MVTSSGVGLKTCYRSEQGGDNIRLMPAFSSKGDLKQAITSYS